MNKFGLWPALQCHSHESPSMRIGFSKTPLGRWLALPMLEICPMLCWKLSIKATYSPWLYLNNLFAYHIPHNDLPICMNQMRLHVLVSHWVSAIFHIDIFCQDWQGFWLMLLCFEFHSPGPSRQWCWPRFPSQRHCHDADQDRSANANKWLWDNDAMQI